MMDDGSPLPLMARQSPEDEISQAQTSARAAEEARLREIAAQPSPLKGLTDIGSTLGTYGVAKARDMPQRAVESLKEAVAAPAESAYHVGRQIVGEEPYDHDANIRHALNIASALTLGAGAGEAPAGALRAGASRIPAENKLFALHTTKSPYLKSDYNFIKAGGLPNPSIGIMKAEGLPFNTKESPYGDIHLIAPKKLVDPKKVNVYAKDSDTAMHPQIINGRFIDPQTGELVPASLENISNAMTWKDRNYRNMDITYPEGRSLDNYKQDMNLIKYLEETIRPRFADFAEMNYARQRPKLDALKMLNYKPDPTRERARKILIESGLKNLFPGRNIADLKIGDPGAKEIADAILGRANAGSIANKNSRDINSVRGLMEDPFVWYDSGFYEAKPERPVKLNEFVGALVPEKVAKTHSDLLSQMPFKHHTYNSDEEVPSLIQKLYGKYSFSKGGKIPRKTWEPIHGLKITPPAEELSSEPDIRDYQIARQKHEFEGGPEPTAPRRPIVLDAPLFGGKYNLGSLPYNYADPVNKAINLAYGQKTFPLYFTWLNPLARTADAYEVAKKISENPKDPVNYLFALGPFLKAGRPTQMMAGAGAGAGASAGKIVAKDDPKMDDIRNAVRLSSNIINHPKRETLPMRLPYGPRFNEASGKFDSPESKDIGFRGPVSNGDHIVSEYSVGGERFQYPSVHKNMSDADLAAVMMAERLNEPRYKSEDVISEHLNKTQQPVNVPRDVDRRAYEAAEGRIAESRSPFYEPGRDEYPAWSPDQQWEQPAIMRAKGGSVDANTEAQKLLSEIDIHFPHMSEESEDYLSPEENELLESLHENYKSGGKVNTVIDRDPDWRMGLETGGVPDEDQRPPVSSEYFPVTADDKGLHLDWNAGIPGKLKRAGQYFYDTMSGHKEMDPTSPEAVEAAGTIAGGLTLGAGAGTAPAGALRAGLVRPKTRLLEPLTEEEINALRLYVEDPETFASQRIADEGIVSDAIEKSRLIDENTLYRGVKELRPSETKYLPISHRHSAEELRDLLHNPNQFIGKSLNLSPNDFSSTSTALGTAEDFAKGAFGEYEDRAHGIFRIKTPKDSPALDVNQKIFGALPGSIFSEKEILIPNYGNRNILRGYDPEKKIFDIDFASPNYPHQRAGGGTVSDALRIARERLASGGVPDESSQEQFLKEQLKGSATQYDPEAGLETAKEFGRAAATMTPPGAIADAAGYLGGPSALENIRNKEYMNAALQLAAAIPGAGPFAKAAKIAEEARATSEAARALPKKSVQATFIDPERWATKPEDNLMAVHNLDLPKLEMAGQAGGFAAPSTAIIRHETPHRKFGDISLVGGKRFAIPAEDLKVYAGDPWTSPLVLRGRPALEVARDYAENPLRMSKEAVFSPEQIRPYFVPELKTFEEVKRRSSLLDPARKSPAKFDRLVEQLKDEMLPYYKGASISPQMVVNRAMIDPEFRAKNFPGISSEIEKKISTLPSAAEKELPEYFESKYTGAANVDPTYLKYEGAIVPESQMSEAKDIMRKLGIRDIVPVKDAYDPDELRKAYEQFKHLRFSEGGEVSDALRVARSRLAYGGLPESYMDDDRYKALQQMGGTKSDPRSEAIGRFLPKMTYHESRDRPLAGAKTSSAAGLAQFTKPTWRAVTAGEPEIAGKSREELYAMRRDPSEEGQRFHMRMAEKLANQNADMLEKAGLPVTPENLYAAHFGGPHGVRAAAAPAGTPLSRIFNRGEIKANPFLRGQTAEGFRKFAQRAINETPRGLPTDLDFQRSQIPSNRYEGLQTAMAGTQQQQPSTQMAYAKPEQRGFSPDLMTPRPAQQPTQVARLPDMNVGNQRMMAADRGPMEGPGPKMAPDREPITVAQQLQPSVPVPDQTQMQQAPEPERPNQDMLEGLEQPFFGLPDFDLAGLFADGGAVNDALRLATGGGAWTRKEGQNPEGGLNAKGRAAAKREGHNLKPPAPHPKTERDAARRRSFCARMSGMKKKLTSAKTANDPDSRINKSLRVWNCAEGGAIWNKARPKKLGKPEPLSKSEKSSAKAAAKAAGRPYPNLVDNMNAAKRK